MNSVLKIGIIVFSVLMLLGTGFLFYRYAVFDASDKKSKKKRDVLGLGGIVCFGMFLMGIFAFIIFSARVDLEVDMDSLVKMNVSSVDLMNNGKWNPIITNTANGENISPELTFNEVEGARAYAVIMIDPDGFNWLHWCDVVTVEEIRELLGDEINGIKGDTISLVSGFNNLRGEAKTYVGPYPPAGTHNYHVYVYALKAVPSNFNVILSGLDKSGANINNIINLLNVYADGSNAVSGNILGTAEISGTYTYGEK